MGNRSVYKLLSVLIGAALLTVFVAACGTSSGDGVDGKLTTEPAIDKGPAGGAGPLYFFYPMPSPKTMGKGIAFTPRNISFASEPIASSSAGISVTFWMLARDQDLLGYQLEPTGVALGHKDGNYPLRNLGTIYFDGGIYKGTATFKPYDWDNSHPDVPGYARELYLSVDAVEVVDSLGNLVIKTIQGPWELLLATRSDTSVNGRSGFLYSYGYPPSEQSQFGVTVRYRQDGWLIEGVYPMEIVKEDSPSMLQAVLFGRDGPYVMSEEEYVKAGESLENRWTVMPGPTVNRPGQPVPEMPEGGGGQQLLQGGGGTATVQVGSALLSQGQQAHIFVKVKSMTDPDGLGGYDFKITWNPTS